MREPHDRMSTSTAIPTRIHSAPSTPTAGDQRSVYMIPVQGRKRSRRSGHSHVANARSTRSPKIHISAKASRGAKSAAMKTRHMGAQSLVSRARRQQAPLPPMDERDLDPDPILAFRAWFREAEDAVPRADAMTLATATADGRPSRRGVLLRGLRERG